MKKKIYYAAILFVFIVIVLSALPPNENESQEKSTEEVSEPTEQREEQTSKNEENEPWQEIEKEIHVPVPESMRSCTSDSDCAFVETKCDKCCDIVGINKDSQKEYREQLFGPACKDYRGSVCDCVPHKKTPVCVDSVCELK